MAIKHSEQDTLNTIVHRSRQNLLTGCMEWQGNKHKKGYGTIRFRQKMEKVHRVIWIMSNGPIPKEMHVCHACDNPCCCELTHLFLGSNQDNIQDKITKDRSGKKLCIGKVKEIKWLLSQEKFSQAEIAQEFGVVKTIISRIKTGKRWSHVEA